jgi:hypothetical protein
MSLPEPEPGLVICYSYLWSNEALRGEVAGRKDRPCVIVTCVEDKGDGTKIVTVMPATHEEPDDATEGVEIPQSTKARLGLDWDRSWVKVNEVNRFVWPGFDLRKIPGREAYAYGFVGPKLFAKIMVAAETWRKRHRTAITSRD